MPSDNNNSLPLPTLAIYTMSYSSFLGTTPAPAPAGAPAPSASLRQESSFFGGSQSQPSSTTTYQHQLQLQPAAWASDADKQAIQREFEVLLTNKLKYVNEVGKMLPKNDVEVCRLFNLIGQGVTKFENGHEWTAELLADDIANGFAQVLGAMEDGGIISTHSHFHKILKAKNMTLEQFVHWKIKSKANEEKILFHFGFGRCTSLSRKLNDAVESFPSPDENTHPSHSNLPPAENSGNLPSTNSFGARGPPPAQNTASFNQPPVEGNPPFNAFPSSTASYQTAATPSSLFSQASQQKLRSEMNLDTQPAGSNIHATAAPTGGGLFASHSNTSAPPAFVATSTNEDPSVASNITQSTLAGGVSAAAAPAVSSAAAKDERPPMDSAPTAPETPAQNVTFGSSRIPFSTMSTKTPKYANTYTPGPTYTSRRGNGLNYEPETTPVPSKLEVREQLRGETTRGSVPLVSVELGMNSGATLARIVEPDKTGYDNLMRERRFYPKGIVELSNHRAMENHFDGIANEDDVEYHLRLRTDLAEWDKDDSKTEFHELVKEEIAKTHTEQGRISLIRNEIKESAAFASSETKQTIENLTHEAEMKTKELLRQKEDIERKLAEAINDLNFNAEYNQKLAKKCLEALDRMNDELKLENASRLAMPLALVQNEIVAKDLLRRAVDIRDTKVKTNKKDVDSLKTDKATFFAQLALIEGGDLKTLGEQAMKILY